MATAFTGNTIGGNGDDEYTAASFIASKLFDLGGEDSLEVAAKIATMSFASGVWTIGATTLEGIESVTALNGTFDLETEDQLLHNAALAVTAATFGGVAGLDLDGVGAADLGIWDGTTLTAVDTNDTADLVIETINGQAVNTSGSTLIMLPQGAVATDDNKLDFEFLPGNAYLAANIPAGESRSVDFTVVYRDTAGTTVGDGAEDDDTFYTVTYTWSVSGAPVVVDPEDPQTVVAEASVGTVTLKVDADPDTQSAGTLAALLLDADAVTAVKAAAADATTVGVDIDGGGTATAAATDVLAFEDLAGGDDVVTGNGFGHAVQLGAGNDSFFGGATAAEGATGADIVFAASGDNEIYAGAGDDIVKTGAGDDVIGGGDGDDYIASTGGADTVYAGAGADEVDVTSDDDATVYGGEGADRLRLGGAGDHVIGGGAGNDTIDGEDGADTIYGGEGDDIVISGGAGNDTVWGGAGEDILVGGQGNDKLYGGADDDALAGGNGNDSFVFEAGGGMDVIVDFAAGDKIDLSAFDLSTAEQADFLEGIGEAKLVDDVTIVVDGFNTATYELDFLDADLDSWFTIGDTSVIVENKTGLVATDFVF